jgi:hypothetical protein
MQFQLLLIEIIKSVVIFGRILLSFQKIFGYQVSLDIFTYASQWGY